MTIRSRCFATLVLLTLSFASNACAQPMSEEERQATLCDFGCAGTDRPPVEIPVSAGAFVFMAIVYCFLESIASTKS